MSVHMSPTMRGKLQRNIDYHLQARDFYKEEAEKEKKATPSTPPPRGQTPPKPVQSAHEKLAEMHDDVANQLMAVMQADPPVTGVEEVVAQQRPHRSLGGRFRPSAGTVH